MSAQENISINHIERKPDSKKYRVVGSGVTVEFLSLFIDDPNWTVERICEGYGLTPAEVYAAWSFYYDHKDETDQRMAEEEQKSLPTQEDIDKRERMLKRYEELHGHPYRFGTIEDE